MRQFSYLPRIELGRIFTVTPSTKAFSAKLPGGSRGRELVTVSGLGGVDDIRALAMGGEQDDLGFHEVTLPVGTRVVKAVQDGFPIWAAVCPGGEKLTGSPFRVAPIKRGQEPTVLEGCLESDELVLPRSETVALFRYDTLLAQVVDLLDNPEQGSYDEDLSALPARCPPYTLVIDAQYVRSQDELSDHSGRSTGSMSHGYLQLPIGTVGRFCPDETIGGFWLARTPQNQWLAVNSMMLSQRFRSEVPRPAHLYTPQELAQLDLATAFREGRDKWWEMNAASDLTAALAAFSLLEAF